MLFFEVVLESFSRDIYISVSNPTEVRISKKKEGREKKETGKSSHFSLKKAIKFPLTTISYIEWLHFI